jgi:UDP-N-acetylmuramyl pentapeptide synthase
MKSIFSFLLLHYFRLLAKVQLWKIKPRVIGITGSAGKSSTMEAVAAVLQEKYTLKVGRKANSESGIPLNILGLTPHTFSLLDWLGLALLAPLKLLTNWEKYDLYIVEMGIDSPHPPKNMGYLLTVLQPEIGIFTSVDAVHSETFDPLIPPETEDRRAALVELIAAEKGRLTRTLPKDGLAVLNADKRVLLENAVPTSAKIMTFGESTVADIQIASVNWATDGTRIVYKTTDEKVTLHFADHLLPPHFAHTFGAALCVAQHLGISPYKAGKLLEKNFKMPPGRATLIPALNGATILDSSYNASAQPMLDFLDLLSQLPAKRKLALLGDMRELGSVAEEDHVRVAKKVAKVVDSVVLVGPLMKEYALPVLQAAKVHTQWFPSAAQAALYLHNQLQKDDILLVKGSQNTLLLEIAIEQLMAHPETADKLLCRRGKYWDGEREKLLS